MAYSMKDVEILTAMVMEEQGENAITHVSNFIDQLRVEKDLLGASLWTMVLALLYHHVPAEALPLDGQVKPEKPVGASERVHSTLTSTSTVLH